ncbi:response regulator [Azonexus sp.]|jgi:two-component system chemotaxis response regulator CheY|uniref:response regulator transcription factor n=1 Tax=Azonexus sp. TaxID=1872668 RepID=UPI002817E268|nr:response regulator [Azonexus sp.]MDR1995329.1 response regulator [Azonexus sp.]
MALSSSLADLSILLVEPSPMQSGLVRRMLEQLGVVRVAVADSGQAALAALAEDAGDGTVVISSLYLPDMAGTDLVAAMRANERQEALPFILISSETRPQRLEAVRQSGACSIITKPFSAKQLERALFAAADYLYPPPVDQLDAADMEELRVLIVDDSIASRRHLCRLLAELGIARITEAANGREAVAALADAMFDLVVTDYTMPEMDGRELIEYIRTHSWQAEVPVLMVTSEQNMGRLAAVERAGVSAICDKPFEAGSIRRLLIEALTR